MSSSGYFVVEKAMCLVIFSEPLLHILNQKYGDTQMTHTCYREYIANYLISTSVETAQIVDNS